MQTHLTLRWRMRSNAGRENQSDGVRAGVSGRPHGSPVTRFCLRMAGKVRENSPLGPFRLRRGATKGSQVSRPRRYPRGPRRDIRREPAPVPAEGADASVKGERGVAIRLTSPGSPETPARKRRSTRAKRKAPPTRRWCQLVTGGRPYSQYGSFCQDGEPISSSLSCAAGWGGGARRRRVTEGYGATPPPPPPSTAVPLPIATRQGGSLRSFTTPADRSESHRPAASPRARRGSAP